MTKESFLPFYFCNTEESCERQNLIDQSYIKVSPVNLSLSRGYQRLGTVLRKLEPYIICSRPELKKNLLKILEGSHLEYRIWRATVDIGSIIMEISSATPTQPVNDFDGRITICNPKELQLRFDLVRADSYKVEKVMLCQMASRPNRYVHFGLWSEESQSVQDYTYYPETSNLELLNLFS